MNTRLLQKILSIPTAPFREHQVLHFFDEIFTKNRVPHFFDPAGNLVVGVGSRTDYHRLTTGLRSPLFTFIAHTDHPGFHGVRWLSPRKLAIRWHGGSPTRFLNGAKVWVCHGHTESVFGVLTQARLNSRGSALAKGVVTFREKHFAGVSPRQLFGGLAFRKPQWVSGRMIYTKAADDLVGAFAIATLALENRRRLGPGGNFLGLLTRAEEVGYIGTLEHLSLGWLGRASRDVLVVSLETSRQFPGAHVGRGPIVRLGDRATVFDPTGVEHLTHTAKRALGRNFQRRIMDGGTCEGTAANAYGFRTIAMSVPLGNYHNQSFEGGPDSRGSMGPAPEFVHLSDVAGLIKVSKALMARPLRWESVWAERIKRFNGLRKTYRHLMTN